MDRGGERENKIEKEKYRSSQYMASGMKHFVHLHMYTVVFMMVPAMNAYMCVSLNICKLLRH